MPDHVDDYLMDLVRHLKGRMPKEKIDDVVNETHGHLLELGARGTKEIKKAFGSSGRYARSLLLAQSVGNVSTWREGRWVFLVVLLSVPGLYYYYENGLFGMRADQAYLVILLVVIGVSLGTRKSVVIPIVTASIVSLVFLSGTLGVFYTQPTTMTPRDGLFRNRIARFDERSPTARAQELHTSLQNDVRRIDSVYQAIAAGQIEESTLKAPHGYWNGHLYANLPNTEFRGGSEWEFDEAVHQWRTNEPGIRQSAKTALEESAQLVSAKWNTVQDETFMIARYAWGFYINPLFAALLGNLIGWLLNSYVLWPRRRNA